MLFRMKVLSGLVLAGAILVAASLVVGPGAHAQQPDSTKQPDSPQPPDNTPLSDRPPEQDRAPELEHNDTNLEVNAAINGGVAAFKSGQYADAAASFGIATRLAPGNALAHLYLGTALAIQVVPNVLTPENTQMASSAVMEFDAVLKLRPDYLPAIKQEATIYRNVQKYDEALSMEKRAVAMNPGDAEATYSLGFLDWTVANRKALKALKDDGDTDDGVGNVAMLHASCLNMRADNVALVNDGIMNLKRAIELKPNNADAMQYLQLMYRRHADFACGDKTALNADLRLAEQWTQKANEARKQAAAPRP
jgi:tetratricopeptide (TPR) repeat protein